SAGDDGGLVMGRCSAATMAMVDGGVYDMQEQPDRHAPVPGCTSPDPPDIGRGGAIITARVGNIDNGPGLFPGRQNGIGATTMIRAILLILLIIILIGALPAWPYSSGWGYYPSSGIGTIIVILIVLALLGII